MSYMREIPYLLTGHYVAIAMRPITFPATKAEIIEKVGGEPIRTPLDEFSCAAEFYCAFNAS